MTTIERLEQLGYTHVHGSEIERPKDEVVLRDVLRTNLAKRYPELPGSALDETVARVSHPEGVDTLRRNMAFHRLLVRGFEVPVDTPDRGRIHVHVHPVQWDDPDGTANDYRVVNQLAVHGKNDRRPDVVVYVNGLPLVVFELKNPYSETPTVEEALNQIQHYKLDIPQLFDYNALVVISDGATTLHGMWTADAEWFAPWKSIDGIQVEANTTGSMKTLVEGLFPKDRLLQYIHDFIAFEEANEKVTKKGAKYHQFFAVRFAVERALVAVRPGADKRIGVIWHTTGSGKSLSMAFLVGILRRHPELENPTFVVEVDRTELDTQLYEQFVAVGFLVGDVKQAEDVDDLRDLLQTEGGEVIFTTIEKFRLGEGEKQHPVLSTRSNLIVIADEAHRSQYGMEKGYARYLAEALPNARRIGFTGTPVSIAGADTTEVFGDLIHTYDIRQAQEDRATVPIFYGPRQVRLHLSAADIDAALQEVAEGEEPVEVQRGLPRWSRLAKLAGTKERVEEIARDVLGHFLDRTATLDGKALLVCTTRENCVRMYDALTALPGCPEIKVVMTSNPAEDPVAWNEAGHVTTKGQRNKIKERMRDIADQLKIVVVCDMWLTGTDIPCLHTLYVDKPMKGHNMIQAISRVNRVFRDKPQGLIVDYIGIGNELREATDKYTTGGGKGKPAPNVEDEGRFLFGAALDNVRSILPRGQDYAGWRELTRIEFEDLCSLVYGTLAEDEERKKSFLDAEHRLAATFLLVKQLDDCRTHTDEVLFYQRARNQIAKTLPGRKPNRKLECAVRDLVDDHVESSGVVDIFQVAGLPQADVSILDDSFLQTFKDRPHENLRLKLLERLLRDEIQRRQPLNVARAKTFRQRLEDRIAEYHARLIDAAAVVTEMVRLRQEMEADEHRARELGLLPEELAFYDAILANQNALYDQGFLRDLVHEVVQSIKSNLKVDWTQPHRDDVKAGIRAAVRRVLRRNRVRPEDLEPFMKRIIEQAEALYADWPIAA